MAPEKTEMFRDLWRLYSRHSEMGNTADDWIALNNDALDLLNKYKSEFFHSLIFGLYKAMESERVPTDEQVLNRYQRFGADDGHHSAVSAK